jgi:hypothetical protein
MYHYELRKFPHTFCVFNQSEQQLGAIVRPWTSGEWVEVGERRWNIHETKLTIIEGPELSLPDLAMNRGWRNARRRGKDVTEQMLGTTGARKVRSGLTGPAVEELPQRGIAHAPVLMDAAPTAAGPDGGLGAAGQGARGGADLLADSLGLELLALLDDGSLPPSRVWEVARMRTSGGSAADSLALAERAVRSLLGRGLVVVRRAEGSDDALGVEEVEAALAAAETWTGGEGAEAIVIARKR